MDNKTYLKKAKLQKYIAITFLILAFAMLVATSCNVIKGNTILIVNVMIVCIAIGFLTISYMNLKKSRNSYDTMEEAVKKLLILKKKRANSIIAVLVVFILLTVLIGGIAIYYVISSDTKVESTNTKDANNDVENEESMSNSSAINMEITSEEKEKVEEILNETQYVSNVPSHTYGQVISSAFIEYNIEYEKVNESVIRVSVTGIFMANPNCKSDYLEVKSVLGEERALELYGFVVYESTIVFQVDLAKRTCKNVYGTEDSTLKAYALESF